MGRPDDEAETATQGPSVKAVSEFITDNWTSAGVYARGSGEDFLQLILPNRLTDFPAFLAEVEQCAGQGSKTVFVATNEECRLDVSLGSRYDSGTNPLVRTGYSTAVILFFGMFSGILATIATLLFAVPRMGGGGAAGTAAV